MSSLPASRPRLVGGQDIGEAEALRGLRPPEPRALDAWLQCRLRGRLLQGIRQGDGGDGARRMPPALRVHASMMSGGTNGRTASWISTRSGAWAANARRPWRDGDLPRRSAEDGRAAACYHQSAMSWQHRAAHPPPR